METVGVLLLIAGGLFWLYVRKVKAETVADMTAERQKEVADAKKREAEILSFPSGDKHDIINRL
jgi:hypothetical protein